MERNKLNEKRFNNAVHDLIIKYTQLHIQDYMKKSRNEKGQFIRRKNSSKNDIKEDDNTKHSF